AARALRSRRRARSPPDGPSSPRPLRSTSSRTSQCARPWPLKEEFLRSFPLLGVLLDFSVRGETSPVDFSPVVLRQRWGELHDARVLEGRQALLHELLELTGQRVVAGALSRHHVGFGFDQ